MKLRYYAPAELTADTSNLSPNDQKALKKIIEAAEYLDPLYRRQVWSGNDALLNKLLADRSDLGLLRLHNFLVNSGPWSQLEENKPFIEGVGPKPPHGSLYPDDMSRQEFDSWVSTLSTEEKEKATGYFYVVRRDDAGKLKTVPYSEEYREFLEPAAKLLRQAASLTNNSHLRDFLNKRAAAFTSNDYYESDMGWMDLDTPLDVTIGPYETYDDELFGYKAQFEAYVGLRDDLETAKLARISQYLQELENHLPVDARYRNSTLGAASPVRVVNEVFSSGQGNTGVQTAAFNLPNDERVLREKGSKRILIRNVQEAKFNKTLVPISRIVLRPEQDATISFDPFFTHILMHELMHGLGSHDITVDGQSTTVRRQLKELYSSIEEAKADMTALWAIQYLIDKGVIESQMESKLYTTYLASMFRSIRFGINEAHGRGVALQLNYFLEEGAVRFDTPTGKFGINNAKIQKTITKLCNVLLTIEAEGSYEKAKQVLDEYSVLSPKVKRALESLSDVPVDIEPVFPLAK